MSSIWKDLLFLHGHITHIDPAFRPDAHDDAGGRKATVNKTTAKKVKSIAVMCCASAWPRLVRPR
ncbi:MAG TPA: hypothetical protein VIO59_01945 [Rhodanobacter sp.]